MNKNFIWLDSIKLIWQESVNIFDCFKAMHKRKEIYLADYFKIIEDDLNCAFHKIRNDKK
ncbi:hypothetical protein [Rickettsia endosymbiont of Halotydeus destructor]|uniref:hypothetical protein n=1 Tax=Rickettsia endosymbiont of Halotydeus destructor TaxID=2996754 RepID=UPI003BAF4F2D